jgi:hypothetical protein
LDAYLTVFKDAGAMRWKCCHCEHFLSYDELEFCELTKDALERFGADVGLDRHMVELQEDGSMRLMTTCVSGLEKEKPRRATSSSNHGTSGQLVAKGHPFTLAKGEPCSSSGVIEIIEID